VIALLYEGDRLVGRAFCALTRYANIHLSSRVVSLALDVLLRRYPVLLCQSLLRNYDGLLLPQGQESEALRTLSQELYRQAESSRASFVVLGYLGETHCQIAGQIPGLATVTMSPGTLLTLNCASFEEYIKNLDSPLMRRNVRRTLREAQRSGVELIGSHEFAQHTPRLHELAKNVLAHHKNYQPYLFGEDFFRLVEQECADHSVVILARIRGEIVGSALIFHDQGVMTWFLLGLDYRFDDVYFCLIYETIRYAIEHGITAIRGGTGAYDFKHRLGFQDVPTGVAYTSPSPVLRALASKMAGIFEDETGSQAGKKEK
jgi:predicted N-acyltransferase